MKNVQWSVIGLRSKLGELKVGLSWAGWLLAAGFAPLWDSFSHSLVLALFSRDGFVFLALIAM